MYLLILFFFSGSLFDVTGSYNPGFILAGTAIGLSGIILFLIPPVQRWQAKKNQKLKEINNISL